MMETNETPEQDVEDTARAESTEATDAVVEPVSDEPEAAAPATEEPDAEEPAAEEPAAEEPAAEEPAPQPVAEEPAQPEPEPEVAEPEPEVAEPELGEPEAATTEPEPAVAEADPSPELVAAVEEAFEGASVEEPVAGAAPGEDAAEEEVVDDWVPGDWYVVHTYAGYENKVKADLESRVASMNMEESIYEVVIPMEEVMEIKGGKKQMVPRKVFPGYLLVRMDLNDDSWYVVRNTPGVTGFVGSGNKPIPLSAKEVDKILRRKGEPEKPKAVTEWQVNDPVRVTTGPFANFQGSISEVDGERQKVKVLVNIFGRETPVELAFDQIAKV